MKKFFFSVLVSGFSIATTAFAQGTPAPTSPYLKFMTCDTRATKGFPYTQIAVFAEFFTQQSQLMLTGPTTQGRETFEVTALVAAQTETDAQAGRTKVTAVINPAYRYTVAVEATANSQGQLTGSRVTYSSGDGDRTARATCRLERLPNLGH